VIPEKYKNILSSFYNSTPSLREGGFNGVSN
jgi:hypothetical protein